MSKHRLATALGAIALVFAGTVAIAQPASAGERVYTNGGPGGCFTVNKQHDSLGRAQVTVWNTCGDYRRVKVIWKYGPDSGCNEMSVLNTKFSDSSSVSAKFDKLVTC